MIKKSIATVPLSGILREKLAAVDAAGFTGVEIFENDLLSFDGTAQDIRMRAVNFSTSTPPP